jgi:hypothetical protein
MLSQEQYFKAKSFLKVYKDSIYCAEQVSRKNSVLNFQSEFYKKLKESHLKKQIVIDEEGNLKKGDFLKSGYFYRMFELVE